MALNVQPLSPMRRMAMALVMALLLAASLGFAQLLIQRGGHQATMVVLKRVHFLPPPGEKEIVVNTAGDLEKGTVHDLPIKVGDAMRKVHAYDFEMDDPTELDRYFRGMLETSLNEQPTQPISVHPGDLGTLAGIEGTYKVGRGADSSFVIGRAAVMEGHVVGFWLSGDGLMTDADRGFFKDYCEHKIEIK